MIRRGMFLLPLEVLLFHRELFCAQEPDQKAGSATVAPETQIKGGTKIEAELEAALDTRTAKAGDEVSAKVMKDIKQKGKTVIRKGDRLLGRVEKVERESASSSVAVTFDRLQQGESTTQLNAVVTSMLSAPSLNFAQREESMEPVSGSPMPARRGARPVGGLVGGVASTVGATASVAGQAAGTANTAVHPAGRTRATPLEVIRVAPPRNVQPHSGTSVLSAQQPQLRLETGTRVRLDVIGQK